MKIEICPYKLQFKQPAGTSRGVYTERIGWYVVVDNQIVGECAPLPDLSADFLACGNSFEERMVAFVGLLRKFAEDSLFAEALESACSAGSGNGSGASYDFSAGVPMWKLPAELEHRLRPYPSILFAFESAVWFLRTNGYASVDTLFARGEASIPINGLVWMGSYAQMKERMEEKLSQGFKCIKLKIGAIDFDDELSLIEQIRKDFPPSQITIRVDANGAFSVAEASDKLHRLAAFGLHSIEQPVKAGQWFAMSKLCATTPLPIALDEELIGVNSIKQKETLLNIIKPHHIVLKPTLHGGITGTMEWIELARKRNIGYWLTSALESNVGLTAIAHLCGVLLHKYPSETNIPQGLGTGTLFTTNQPSSLSIVDGAIINLATKH